MATRWTQWIRRQRCALVGVMAAAACRPEPATEPNPHDDEVASDLEVLCIRIAQRSVAAWSQPAYRTAEVRDLTLAIDHGDDTARCTLGRRMRALDVASCRTTRAGLLDACDDA